MHRRTYIKSATGVLAGGFLAGCTAEEEGNPTDAAGEVGGGETTTQRTTSSNGVEVLWTEFYEEDYSSGVRGEVQNNAGETLSMVTVDVYFYDGSGSRLEDSLDNISDLGAGQRWKFNAPYIGTTEPSEYEVRVDVTDF